MIHYATCRRPDEREHRLPLSTGEVVITTVCRSCGASHERIADRDDVEPEPPRKRWPFPPEKESAS